MLCILCLQPEIYENFKSVTLKPEQFSEYLLSKEVGFSTCEVVDMPFNKSKGMCCRTFTFGCILVNSVLIETFEKQGFQK